MAFRAARDFAELNDTAPIARLHDRMPRAIVLGGSLAGLMAARVLADASEDVVIVERDDLPRDVRPRRGTPQDRHLHTLMHGGHRQLERFYPGLTESVCARGGLLAGPGELAAFMDGRRKVSDGTMGLLTASRQLLENEVRRHTLRIPNIRVHRAAATGVEISGGRVVGVRLADVDEMLSADLVVDAMGRNSRMDEWLAAAGRTKTRMQRVPIAIDYATGYFSREEWHPGLIAALAFGAAPPTAPRVAAGAFQAVEGDRWLVTLASYGRQPRPADEDEFRGLCAQYLPKPFMSRVSGDLRGELEHYHQADSRRRDVVNVPDRPGGLVTLGDSLASYNPIYGQGMSSAALQVSALWLALRHGWDPHSRPVRMERLHRVVTDAAWTLSSMADLTRPDLRDHRPRGFALAALMAKHVAEASVVDVPTARRFNGASYMRLHPSALLGPASLGRSAMVNLGALAHVPNRHEAQRPSSPRRGGPDRG